MRAHLHPRDAVQPPQGASPKFFLQNFQIYDFFFIFIKTKKIDDSLNFAKYLIYFFVVLERSRLRVKRPHEMVLEKIRKSISIDSSRNILSIEHAMSYRIWKYIYARR